MRSILSKHKEKLSVLKKGGFLFAILGLAGVFYVANLVTNVNFSMFNLSPNAKVGPIDATKNTYEKKVMAILYMPDLNDDGILDPDLTGYTGYVDVIHDKKYGIKVTDMKQKLLDQINYSIKYLTNATKYHGYKDSSATASVKYSIDSSRIFENYTMPPRGKKIGNDLYYPNYKEILERYNICELVNNKGVSEVWMFSQDGASLKPLPSNMYSKDAGDISDDGDNNDLPKCNKSYTVYNFNIAKGLDEVLKIKAKHIEKLLNNWPKNNDLYWKKFVGSDNSKKIVNPGCGYPALAPNESNEDKYKTTNSVNSDCEDFRPDRLGNKKDISCKTWNNYFYGKDECKDDKGFSYYLWWMQNIPGYGNNLYDGDKKLRNWWDYIGDIDKVADRKGYLYLAGSEYDDNSPTPTPLPNAPKVSISSPSGSKTKFPFSIKWNKISNISGYDIEIYDNEHRQTVYTKSVNATTTSISIKLDNLKNHDRLENDDELKIKVTAKTNSYGNISSTKSIRVDDVEDEKPSPTPKPTPKPTPRPTRRPGTTNPTPRPIGTPKPTPKPTVKAGEPIQIPFPSGGTDPVVTPGEPIPTKPNNAAQILFPLSVNLIGSEVNVTWSFGTNATSYQLISGKSSDSNEYGLFTEDGKSLKIINSVSTLNLGGLPTDGSDVYIGIRTNFSDGGSIINTRLYKAAGGDNTQDDDTLDNIDTNPDDEIIDDGTTEIDTSTTEPQNSPGAGGFWAFLRKLLSIITFGLIKAQ